MADQFEALPGNNHVGRGKTVGELLRLLGGIVAVFGIASVILAAAATVHYANGFFMNWSGRQKGEGEGLRMLKHSAQLAAGFPQRYQDVRQPTRASGVGVRGGVQYHLFTLGLALIVMVYGAGKVSLDRLIARPTEVSAS